MGTPRADCPCHPEQRCARTLPCLPSLPLAGPASTGRPCPSGASLPARQAVGGAPLLPALRGGRPAAGGGPCGGALRRARMAHRRRKGGRRRRGPAGGVAALLGRLRRNPPASGLHGRWSWGYTVAPAGGASSDRGVERRERAGVGSGRHKGNSRVPADSRPPGSPNPPASRAAGPAPLRSAGGPVGARDARHRRPAPGRVPQRSRRVVAWDKGRFQIALSLIPSTAAVPRSVTRSSRLGSVSEPSPQTPPA